MKVAVLGAGAVGCLLGGLLSTRHEVTMIGRDEVVRAIRRHGLVIDGLMDLTVRPHAVTDSKDAGPQDLVLITVKSHDTDQAILDAMPMVMPWTQVLVVQNGLGVLRCARRLNGALVHIGVASLGVNRVGPGHVRYAGNGSMAIGAFNGRRALAELLAAELREVDIEAEQTDDILTAVWRKAVINSAINPITALLGKPNGCISNDDGLKKLSEDVFNESMAVAVTGGFLAPGSVTFDDVMRVVISTAENRSSMLQDLERGRRTEIESINGAICRAAKDGSMVVLNRSLVAFIRNLEGRG